MIPSLETIDWRGFLARPMLAPPKLEALETIGRQPILITGAGGSIGSALALRLVDFASHLILLESSESHLYALQEDWPQSSASVTPHLGSVADPQLLDEIFASHGPCLIFHAAAFKHVPLMEAHPLAAIANNVFGTAALVRAASANGSRVVLLSTDKAVDPVSIMGATKRIAEHIVLSAGGSVVRLGNVLASRDSVAEIFARQIEASGPITVTDPAARRYFLTIDEAVNLLLEAALESRPSILAPAISAPHFIADLARFMARELAPDREISIEFTHPREGDKESESFWSSTESASPALSPSLVMIHSSQLQLAQFYAGLAALRAAFAARDLSAALSSLCSLVPEYTPTKTVRAVCARQGSQVAP